MVPFNSRHPSDGRDRFLGDIHDEEEYDQFLKMILISSNFAHEIPSHYDSSEADVLPPSSSEVRQGNYQKNTTVNTTKRSSSNHTCVESVEKLCHEKSERCKIQKQCLVKILVQSNEQIH